MDSLSGVGVLDKAVAVLGALEDEPLALAGLVSATGLSRPTVHRLAVALETHGLLRRDAEGRFCLGGRLVELGRAAATSLPLATLALPALEDLLAATGESVQLYVRDGDARLCVASLESPHGLRTIVPLGARLPLSVGSAAEVLADSPAVARRGWAESVAQREAGVASVSAPVRSGDGRVLAAVSVSGPIERVSRQPGRRYSADVVAAASTVTEAVRRGA